jgi:hypothetical protein
MPSSYSSEQTATISLNNLASNTYALSDAINNSSTLYDAALVVLTTDITSAGYVVITLAGSTDNSIFSAPSISDSYARSNQYTFAGVKTEFFYIKDLPIYFKFCVFNLTTGSFDSTGHSLKYRGINY